MLKYMLAVVLLLLFGGSTTPALAHAPKVGERAWFTMTCREEAHDVLLELARTKGMSWVQHRLTRFVNAGQCVLRLPAAPGVVTAVEGPVYVANGRLALYSMEFHLDGDDPGSTWFAAHSEVAEGEES